MGDYASEAGLVERLRKLFKEWMAAPEGHWADMLALELIIQSYENPMPAVVKELVGYKGGVVELRVWLAIAAGLFDAEILHRLRANSDLPAAEILEGSPNG